VIRDRSLRRPPESAEGLSGLNRDANSSGVQPCRAESIINYGISLVEQGEDDILSARWPAMFDGDGLGRVDNLPEWQRARSVLM
jgi:hypothetical protein